MKTKKELHPYYLRNEDHCVFDGCWAMSARAARAIFAKKFSGEFIVEAIDGHDYMCVML